MLPLKMINKTGCAPLCTKALAANKGHDGACLLNLGPGARASAISEKARIFAQIPPLGNHFHRKCPGKGRNPALIPESFQRLIDYPSSFHLIEQPMLGICSAGPLPVRATSTMASNKSRRASGGAACLRLASRRPRYCNSRSAL